MNEFDYILADDFDIEKRFGFVCDKVLEDNDIRIVHLKSMGGDFICIKCEYKSTPNKPCVWTVQAEVYNEPKKVHKNALNCNDPLAFMIIIHAE